MTVMTINRATLSGDGSNLGRFRFWHNTDSAINELRPTLVMSGQLSDKWQVTEPISLETEQEGGLLFVSYDQLQAYGSGDSYPEAYADFVSMLLEQYEELLESEEILAPGLKQVLDTYRTILVPL